jgi:predicted sugar kinase
LNGKLGRLYGRIGVALENPRTVVAAKIDNRLIVENGGAERVFEKS